jgi:hypothetical protein
MSRQLKLDKSLSDRLHRADCRRKLIPLLFWVTAALTLPRCANANWQYTRWGMTPEQVINASHGAAHLVPYDPGKSRSGFPCLARGSYSAGSAVFDTYFCFDEQRYLKFVLLEIKNPDIAQIEELKAALLEKYGTPQVKRDRDSWIWNATKDNNAIQFNDAILIPSISVIYRPGNNGMSKGL